jgi:hypothetical protein
MNNDYTDSNNIILSSRLSLLTIDSKSNPNFLNGFDNTSSDQFSLIIPDGTKVREDVSILLDVARQKRPDVDIFYADEILHQASVNKKTHFCKPELDFSMLVANNYIGFPVFIRNNVLIQLLAGKNKLSNYDLYSILIKAALSGIVFQRIPEFLIMYETAYPQLTVSERISILESQFKESGRAYSFVKGLTDNTVRLRKNFEKYPAVTIIIPTNRSKDKNNETARPYILNMLDSFVNLTWPMDKIRVIIGDNKGVNELYDGTKWPFELKVIDTPKYSVSFNYARKMNDLWRLSETENIILMNDDIVVNSKDFIESLLTFSTEPNVGGVGARLLFPNGNLQHAGMVGGIFEVFAHPWYNHSSKVRTYGDWALIHREYSAVTGAVFATRRSVLEKINGFDEFFSLDFNDTDMCLRMKLLGYKIVYTPFANMTHHERATIGTDFAPGEQIMKFLNKWRDVIKNDPMYSPNLSRNQDDIVCHLDT